MREATEDDIPRLVEMGRQFHAMSDYNWAEYDPEAIASMLRGFIASDQACAYCHDHGVIGGVLTPLYFSPSNLIAVETFWWAERDGGQLLTAFEWWAETKGAKAMSMSRLEGKRDRVVDCILRKRGYSPAEHSYLKGL
jgi:hypothetical protein